MSCWMRDFKTYVEGTLSSTFPVEPSQFSSTLKKFVTESATGEQWAQEQYIGFEKDTLRFFSVSGKSEGNPRAPYDDKYPIYE